MDWSWLSQIISARALQLCLESGHHLWVSFSPDGCWSSSSHIHIVTSKKEKDDRHSPISLSTPGLLYYSAWNLILWSYLTARQRLRNVAPILWTYAQLKIRNFITKEGKNRYWEIAGSLNHRASGDYKVKYAAFSFAILLKRECLII